jgi:hypothetical protein
MLGLALLATLAIVTPALADTYYFVQTYGEPQEPYPYLEAEVMEVSGDSAVATPAGYTSVTLSELHGMDLESPSEVYDAAVDSGTAWGGLGGPHWHYANYFQTLWNHTSHMKYICCGSKVWRDLFYPGWMGLALKTWDRAVRQPWVLLRDQPRGVKWGWEYNSYGKWSHPDAYTLEWKQEGWFDDGNINNQVYKVDTIWW